MTKDGKMDGVKAGRMLRVNTLTVLMLLIQNTLVAKDINADITVDLNMECAKLKKDITVKNNR